MTSLVQSQEIQNLLDRVAGLGQPGGDVRFKQILRRVVSDLYATIDAFDVTPEEFWSFVHFLQNATPELGLIAPGLGFDHFLDVRMDAEDKKARHRGQHTPHHRGPPLRRWRAALPRKGAPGRWLGQG